MRRARAANAALQGAEALADAATIVARRIPAPRGLPFYGLDHPPGVLDRMLAELSDLGIFRVYSHVLDLSGGLGGPARWLARRHSCRVTLAACDPTIAGAAALLTMRAHLAERVGVAVGHVESLPFARDAFTHAWGIGIRERISDARAVLVEAWRALRPGGWLALAEARSDASDPLAAVEAALRAVGFAEIKRLELDSLVEDDSTAAALVLERVTASLGTRAGAEERAGRPRSWVGLRARKPA